jgi:hypothetical protein
MTVNPTNGLVSWNPATADVGTRTVTFRVTDGRGGSAEQTFTLTVVAPGTGQIGGSVFLDANTNGVSNGAPTEPGLQDWTVYLDQNGNRRQDEGELAARTDAGGHYAFARLAAGSYSVRLHPPSGWRITAPASESFELSLTGGQIVSGLDFGAFPPTNGLLNAGPAFVSSPPTNSLPANAALLYEALARDSDGDTPTYDLVTAPAGMLVETNTGVVAWRPMLVQIGTHDVILRASDGRGGVALQSFQITVTAPNSPPVLTSFPPGPAVVGLPYRYHVRAQDAEGQALAFLLGSNAPAGMSLNSQPSTLNLSPGLLTRSGR